MATRLVGFFVFLLGCSIFLPSVSAALAGPSQQATAAAEPSGPKPSATVEKMLHEASRLAEAKQPLDSLKAADQALEAARQTNDTAGGALAQQARAKALQDLQRADEALTAWQEAAHIWAEVGDTPEQITTLVHAGLLCLPSKKSDAEKLFAEALPIGKSQSQRPVAVAQALHDSGVALDAQGQEQAAWDYLSAALAIREKQTPQSLKLVETLNAVAKLAINRATDNTDAQYCSLAIDYSARAAEIGQRLAPDSSMVVESLHRLGFSEYFLSGRNPAAREHYLAALRIQKKLAPGGSMEEASILLDLGNLEDTQKHFAAAHEHLEEAVAIGEKLGPASLQFERSLEDLAIVETDEGDLPAARDHLQRALGIKEKLHGRLAPIFVNLGIVALYQYDLASARDYLEKALALFIKNNPNGSGVGYALANLSETFYRQGDFAPALEYCRRSLAILQDKEAVSVDTAEVLSGMGDILRAQGKFSSAADY